jgi:hypothetical protein
MKLTLPEGFMPPKNARPGESFEVVATLSQEEDGSFELEAIDGVKLADTDEEEDSVEEMSRTDSTNIKLPFEEEE